MKEINDGYSYEKFVDDMKKLSFFIVEDAPMDKFKKAYRRVIKYKRCPTTKGELMFLMIGLKGFYPARKQN